MRTLRRSVVVFVLAFGLSLIGVAGCHKSPTSPTDCPVVDGYNACLPLGPGNVPPSPPAGTPTLSVKVDFTKGDCSADKDIYNCAGDFLPTPGAEKVFPDEQWTYVIPVDYVQKYTARACMTHPQWRERVILMNINAGNSPGNSSGIVLEGVTRSPLCIGTAFNMTIPGGSTNTNAFSVLYSESSYDLLESTPVWKQYGVRILGSKGN